MTDAPQVQPSQPEEMPVTAPIDLSKVQSHISENEFIIETRDLVKEYANPLGKKFVAVNQMVLQVPRGAIYGFVGSNGAGKTSTMRILATLMKPTKGQAFVGGREVTKNILDVRRKIGYMPDFFGVYDDMKVWEYLDFFAACYEIPDKDRPAMIKDLLELVELNHRRDDMVDKLSRGMKQRLCLARTLVHDPQVLILDEPASGLDARARIEIRELLVELANMGKTIFFSTHILADVEEICTHIGIVEAGKLIVQGKIDDVRRQMRPHREAVVTLMSTDTQDARQTLSTVPGVIDIQPIADEQGRKRLRISFEGDDTVMSQMMQAMAAKGIAMLNFTEQSENLESVFMRLTKGIVS
jgi:ABC-2 type transport system ATP-binding protein